MSYATAAPAHFPYRHRTVEQVDRDHARSKASNKPANRRAAQFGKDIAE